MPKKRAIIVDIDGCILDSRPIEKYLPEGRGTREEWDEYQTHYNKCKPNWWLCELMQLVDPETYILLVTARENTDISYKITSKMMFNIFGESFSNGQVKLMMRAIDDYRPSYAVKKDIYNTCIKDKYDVQFAIDDEDGNIHLFKKLGIPCLKCFQ